MNRSNEIAAQAVSPSLSAVVPLVNDRGCVHRAVKSRRGQPAENCNQELSVAEHGRRRKLENRIRQFLRPWSRSLLDDSSCEAVMYNAATDLTAAELLLLPRQQVHSNANVGEAAQNPEVVLTNLHGSFTGVSATIANLFSQHAQKFDAVVLGHRLPTPAAHVGWRRLLRFLWRRPPGRHVRIWHARRNNEMLVGLLLKYVLRSRLKLVFTSVAVRRHSRFPRTLMSAMDAIIATTHEAAAFAPRCDAVVPHGVDTRLFTPPDDKLQSWRVAGLPGRYGIGVFGRIRPEKGIDLFVEAMCRVLPRHPDFTAVIAGRWKAKHRSFQQSLARQIDEAGLHERVIWLGEVPAEQRHVWFQRISLCVSAARYEGFGLTPIEAMSCGAAAVTTRTGIFPSLIEDGETGYVVDVDNVDALSARIEQCLRDPEKLMEMGQNSRRHVVQHYDIRREAAGIERVYQQIFDREL